MRFSRGGGDGQKSKTRFYGKTGDIFSTTSYKTETMPKEQEYIYSFATQKLKGNTQ
jgi:hypothetical protein